MRVNPSPILVSDIGELYLSAAFGPILFLAEVISGQRSVPLCNCIA